MKINNFLKKFRFVYKLKTEVISKCETVIDLGCGKSSPINFFSHELKYSLGIDSHLASIQESMKTKIHNEYLMADILEACIRIPNNSFDCALALNVIEHLEKGDGEKLIKEMERIARKKIIIYTPNGFLKQNVFEDNPFQKHLSGWRAKEMKKMGFNLYGMCGLKTLKKEFGEIKYKPRLFWKFISSLSQILTYYFTDFSFMILCVKKLDKA